jgi:hypothetical protein
MVAVAKPLIKRKSLVLPPLNAAEPENAAPKTADAVRRSSSIVDKLSFANLESRLREAEAEVLRLRRDRRKLVDTVASLNADAVSSAKATAHLQTVVEQQTAKATALELENKRSLTLEAASDHQQLHLARDKVEELTSDLNAAQADLRTKTLLLERSDETLGTMLHMESALRQTRETLTATRSQLDSLSKQFAVISSAGARCSAQQHAALTAGDLSTEGLSLFPFVLELLAAFPESPVLQCESVALLSHLAVHESCVLAGPLRLLRTHLFVLAAMRQHQQNPGMLINGACLLHRVCVRGSEQDIRELRQFGAVQVSVTAVYAKHAGSSAMLYSKSHCIVAY